MTEYRIRNETEKVYMMQKANAEIAAIQKSGGVVAVEVNEYKGSRSISANALYWIWLALLVDYFNKKGFEVVTSTDDCNELVKIQVDKDYLHMLLKDKFLGYVNGFMMGKTNIDRQLKSTAKLSKTEFCFYMEQIEKWALGLGIILPQPGDSEYMKYKEAQER